jgi:hypothetical protein
VTSRTTCATLQDPVLKTSKMSFIKIEFYKNRFMNL